MFSTWSRRRRFAVASGVASVTAVALYALSPFLFFVLSATVAVVFGMTYLAAVDERESTHH